MTVVTADPDLDLAQVRAFVATAGTLHFRRAAEQLTLTQQAVSKRISRLEETLGTRLFERGGRTVELTEAGARFLAPARALLTAGDAAVAALRQSPRPVRLDVWGHLFAPLRTVREVLDLPPPLHVEVGPGRDLPGVAGALLRGESDAGFGRFHRSPDGRSSHGQDEPLAHRLVRLEPVDAVLAADHPLARADALRPAELAGLRLLLPATAERLDFLQRFAEHFGVPMLPGEANLGPEHFLGRVRTTPDAFTLLPAELPLPAGSRLAAVPLVEPTPLYAWSLVWCRNRQEPGVTELLRRFAEVGGRRRWLEYRPERDWLPAADQVASRWAAG
ncbi:LysR family transcriptional regulator [Kitasatospora sp. NPDC101801]|uniref:LysR family transcriptional regulator n=1 Tax=Kitasatospora sp. NPDC101801 TaxID=3364103 RepID=UPI0037FF4B7E